MSGKYRIEASGDYPAREFEVNTSLKAGIYVESLVPGTPLPYRLREIRKTHGIDTGYVLDGEIHLDENAVNVSPQVDQALMMAYLAALHAKRPVTPEDAEIVTRVNIAHDYIRRESGLKLLIPQGDREFTVRLHPPDAPDRPYLSRPSVWKRF